MPASWPPMGTGSGRLVSSGSAGSGSPSGSSTSRPHRGAGGSRRTVLVRQGRLVRPPRDRRAVGGTLLRVLGPSPLAMTQKYTYFSPGHLADVVNLNPLAKRESDG